MTDNQRFGLAMLIVGSAGMLGPSDEVIIKVWWLITKWVGFGLFIWKSKK